MNWILFILLWNENSLFSAINPCFNLLALCEYFHMELLKTKDKTTKHNFSYWKLHFTLKCKFLVQCNKPYFNLLALFEYFQMEELLKTKTKQQNTTYIYIYWTVCRVESSFEDIWYWYAMRTEESSWYFVITNKDCKSGRFNEL